MTYQILGVIVVAIIIGGSLWWALKSRERNLQNIALVKNRNSITHRLDRIRRAGL